MRCLDCSYTQPDGHRRDKCYWCSGRVVTFTEAHVSATHDAPATAPRLASATPYAEQDPPKNACSWCGFPSSDDASAWHDSGYPGETFCSSECMAYKVDRFA